MKILSKLFKRNSFPDLKTEHKVKEAFVFDGVQYYEFDDTYNTPCDRAFSAMDYYEELRQRCTREYLKAHIEATENLLTDKKINIFKIRELNQFLKERVDFVYDSDLVYKLASVIYFDKSENPYKYDMKYGQEKIRKWKESDQSLAFFLETPIRKLLPFQDISEEDLANFEKTMEKVKIHQFSNLSSNLSSAQRKSDWYNTAESQNSSIVH